MSSTVVPSRSSITRNAAPSSVTSSSTTRTAPACFTELAMYPSRRNRDRMSSCELSSGWSIFTANSAWFRCVAAYTAAMPPIPITRSRWYLPTTTDPTR